MKDTLSTAFDLHLDSSALGDNGLLANLKSSAIPNFHKKKFSAPAWTFRDDYPFSYYTLMVKQH